MTTFNHFCEICQVTLSDTRNALSLHIRSHDISKEDYYARYIDERTSCKGCGNEVKFRNLQIGYSEYCHRCSVKEVQWKGEKGEQRKLLFSQKMAERGGGASLGGAGKRKGSKNKNPYPRTEKVLDRIEKAKTLDRGYNRDPSKIAKQKQAWESMSDDRIIQIQGKRDETIMTKGFKFYQGKYTPRNPEKYEGDPTQIIFRSSWEKRFFIWCDTNPSVLKWSSEELVIPYKCVTDDRWHRYFPDAMLKIRNKDGQVVTYIVEIKPDTQTRPPIMPKKKTKRYIQEVMTWGKNDAKWEAAREYCADRGYEFMILTEYDLGIKKAS